MNAYGKLMQKKKISKGNLHLNLKAQAEKPMQVECMPVI